MNQTFSNIEIICIESHSSDQTLEKLKSWQKKDSRIQIYPMNQKTDAASARNLGLKVAKGDYITFVDSDDFVAINFLEDFYQISKETAIPIIRNDHKHIDQEEYNNMPLIFNGLKTEQLIDFEKNPQSIILYSAHITGALYRKSAIQTEFLTNYIWEDLPFFVETSLQNKKVYYVNSIYDNNYYFHRVNESGVTKSLEIPSERNLHIIDVLSFLLKKMKDVYQKNANYRNAIDGFNASYLLLNLELIFFSSKLTLEESKERTILLTRIYQYYFPNFLNQIIYYYSKEEQIFHQNLKKYSFSKTEDIQKLKGEFLNKSRSKVKL